MIQGSKGTRALGAPSWAACTAKPSLTMDSALVPVVCVVGTGSSQELCNTFFQSHLAVLLPVKEIVAVPQAVSMATYADIPRVGIIWSLLGHQTLRPPSWPRSVGL